MVHKPSEDAAVSWKSYKNIAVRSTAGCLQLFTDKSKVSLLADASALFTSLKALTVLDDLCRSLISNQKPVVAYLQIHFEMQNSEGSSQAVSVYRNAS